MNLGSQTDVTRSMLSWRRRHKLKLQATVEWNIHTAYGVYRGHFDLLADAVCPSSHSYYYSGITVQRGSQVEETPLFS